MDDKFFMEQALAQARRAELAGEVPVGALLVRDGQIIADHNRTIGNHDPSGHAEIIVLRRAGQHFNNHRLTGAAVYCTLEPCLMCLGALLQARVEKLVFAAWDPRFGACGSQFDLARSKQLNFQIKQLQGGLMEEEARALLQNFFKARRKK